MTAALPMTVAEVTLHASAYPDRQEWEDRITYDGVSLLVPDDLVPIVEAIDPVQAQKDWLTAYTAGVRSNLLSGGLTVSSISPIAFQTDPLSRNAIDNAIGFARANPGATVDWKMADGSFVVMDEAKLVTVANAVAAFVQSGFTCENNTDTAIGDGSVSTRAQVDAAFDAIPNVVP